MTEAQKNPFEIALDELGADAPHIVVYGCGRGALQVKGFAMRLFHLGFRAPA